MGAFEDQRSLVRPIADSIDITRYPELPSQTVKA
jgi:hypothetical protein